MTGEAMKQKSNEITAMNDKCTFCKGNGTGCVWCDGTGNTGGLNNQPPAVDLDTRALAWATIVMGLIEAQALPGGAAQLKAKVQGAFVDAMRSATLPKSSDDELDKRIYNAVIFGTSHPEMYLNAPLPPSVGGEVEVLGYAYVHDGSTALPIITSPGSRLLNVEEPWNEIELVDRAHVTALSAQLTASQARVAELTNALQGMIFGAAAVAVHHDGERAALQMAVNMAEAALAQAGDQA